jgi:hypothetical protein
MIQKSTLAHRAAERNANYLLNSNLQETDALNLPPQSKNCNEDFKTNRCDFPAAADDYQ